jgi:hypothetical protein
MLKKNQENKNNEKNEFELIRNFGAFWRLIKTQEEEEEEEEEEEDRKKETEIREEEMVAQRSISKP